VNKLEEPCGRAFKFWTIHSTIAVVVGGSPDERNHGADGRHAVGATRCNYAGSLPWLGFVAVGGTLTRMTAKRIPQSGSEVRAAATRISYHFGYRKQSESTDFTDGTDEKQSNL